MPRQARINISGELYHAIARGIERRKIYRNNKDRKFFVHRLGELLIDCKVKCFAWAMLDNHFHLLVMPTEANLSVFMQRLLCGYAINFNIRHKRSGHLFQNRYKSILCQKENYFLELVRYIHLNPLRAGIVKDLNELNNYPWSGHATLMRKAKRSWQETSELYRWFAKNEKKAISNYFEFVKEARSEGYNERFRGGGLRRSAGGWTVVKEMAKDKVFWQCDDRILGDGDYVDKVCSLAEIKISKEETLKKNGWDITRLSNEVCKFFFIRPEELKRRGRKSAVSKARSLVAYLGNKVLGISVTEMARYLQISKSSAFESIVRGEKMADKFLNRTTELRPLMGVDGCGEEQ